MIETQSYVDLTDEQRDEHLSTVSEALHDVFENFEHDTIVVNEVHYEPDASTEFPPVMGFIELEWDHPTYYSSFTYPLTQWLEDRHEVRQFDHVVDFEDEVVKIRIKADL